MHGLKHNRTNSFRTQINTGYLPSENSIDHAGCFGKYQFETGQEKERLFSTIYSSAYSPDPISGEMEHYICVGMNSCKDGEGFYQHGGRPPLALALTVDISGSMSSGDKLTNAKTAMLTGLLPRLKPTDRCNSQICSLSVDSHAGWRFLPLTIA